MKQIKFLSYLIASIVFLSFISCGSDKDHFDKVSNDSEIIGTWSSVNASVKIEGKNKPLIKEFQKGLDDLIKNYKGVFVFNSDGTFTSSETGLGVSDTDNGTFTITNGKIYMINEDGDRMTCDIVRHDDTIKMLFDMTDNLSEMEGVDLSIFQITKITMELTLVKTK